MRTAIGSTPLCNSMMMCDAAIRELPQPKSQPPMGAFVGLTGRVQAQPPEDGFFRAVKALPEIGLDRRRGGRSTDAAGSTTS
jgi:hypothetical protein